MRRILIDPLSEPVQIALSQDRDIIAMSSSSAKDRALALDEAFRGLGEVSNIEEIVVINGPGNFTAIRAGIGYARGLGLAFGCATRGISIMDVDHQLSGSSVVARNARGDRAYLSHNGHVILIDKVDLPNDVVSFDGLDGTLQNSATNKERMSAFLICGEADIGTSPASANYIRPADAAPSNIIPPNIIKKIS